MTGDDAAQLQEQGLYAGFILAGLIFGALLALYAAVEAWHHHQARKTRQGAQEPPHDVQAGIDAGWHDPSPTARRRDR